MSLTSLSSVTALLAVVFLSVSVRRTLARIKVLEAQRSQALALLDLHRPLVACLVPLRTAAMATLSPCPHCDLGEDEVCLCDARRQALRAAVREAELTLVRYEAIADPEGDQ